jgi:hypothetical protein
MYYNYDAVKSECNSKVITNLPQDLGLWVSVDPARQFMNPYAYAGNGFSPVNGVDGDGNEFDDTGKALFQKAVDNNFWGNKDIEKAYTFANETSTKISVIHRGVVLAGQKHTLAGETIPGIIDKLMISLSIANNNHKLNSATVLLSETGANAWAESLGISKEEVEARTAAHEFEAHIRNFTPYYDENGTDPVDIDHEKIKDIDYRLYEGEL